ncbi:MAG: ABC transporter ATP-binding protein [Clostridiaceae bacterium]|jgi:ATP-binding cassette subfamily B protein|nr:ABC transporter ATP-binding protein [Clostridiaceae bacterium]
MTVSKTKNRMLANIIYYLRIWHRTFPAGILLILLSVPLTILSIYYQIRIPQLLIKGIECGDSVQATLLAILYVFLIMTICKMLMEICRTKLMTRGSRPMMWLYSVPVHDKIFSMPYQQLISADVQNQIVKLESITTRGGDGGPIHFFGVNFSGFLIALTGMAVFTREIVHINPWLLLAMLMSTVLHLVYGIYAGKYTERNMRERSDSEKKERYIIRTVEDRHYAKDIRLFRLLTHLKRLFRVYHDEHASYLKKESNVQAGSVLISALAVFTRDVLAYIYLTHQLLSGILFVSEFVYLVALVTHFSMWMNHIAQNANDLIIFSAQMKQFRAFIEMDTEENEGTLAADTVSSQPEIVFSDISFHYPGSDKLIFSNFNLRIAPGEKLALVGINGAGKTTLMHLLMGLLTPSCGRIMIDGKDSRDFIKEEYYRLFSPVFQDITVFPESIAANIAGNDRVNKEKLHSVIKTAGFSDYVHDLPDKERTKLVRDSADSAIDLSGGLNQRMLLARALYKDAPINILDEPTAALDPLAESRMYEEYDTMSQGKTSIFISHRLASTRFCDRIILLENGEILEEGTHQELMKNKGAYFTMFEAQSAYYQEDLCEEYHFMPFSEPLKSLKKGGIV